MLHFQTDALRQNTVCRQEHAQVSSTVGPDRRANNERPRSLTAGPILLPIALSGEGYRKEGRQLLVSERMLPALSCLQAAGQRRQAHHAVP